jgi:hypothetical protein
VAAGEGAQAAGRLGSRKQGNAGENFELSAEGYSIGGI